MALPGRCGTYWSVEKRVLGVDSCQPRMLITTLLSIGRPRCEIINRKCEIASHEAAEHCKRIATSKKHSHLPRDHDCRPCAFVPPEKWSLLTYGRLFDHRLQCLHYHHLINSA